MPSIIQKQYRLNNITDATKYLVVAGNYVLVGWNIATKGTTNAYLKLFNAAATTDVTLGTTAPIRTLVIPASGTALLSNEDEFQVAFPLGMVYAVTGDLLDTDTSSPAGACMVEILYSANS